MKPHGFVESLRQISHSHGSFSKKVKDATNNDPWGPTGSTLNEISKGSSQIRNLQPLIKVISKRLSSTDPKRWRKILKTLTLVLFVIQVGAIEFVNWCKANQNLFSRFHRFEVTNGIDYHLTVAQEQEQTKNIRNKSDLIMSLLQDDSNLQTKRTSFHRLRSDMSNPGDSHDTTYDYEEEIDEVERVVFPARGTRSLDLNRQEIFGKFEDSNGGFSSDDSMELDSPAVVNRRRQLSILMEESEEISRSRKGSVSELANSGISRTATMPTRRFHHPIVPVLKKPVAPTQKLPFQISVKTAPVVQPD
ncbi:unnamed protein product [Kuraishia capsulata CBS 1993]|uniref:ENTH domain-containing protein n=1 Tax=Kuraishia capsulata CBS 1993 TaxID=1382522 RepID=W6MNG3_9ASCO|nr:uncharacterized protein KUCA_T00003797001 [Kuraishia capsulata CBS 1993]CDK27818.1 unnamed protein product [Kuraishia capsulata CBS 1993]